MKRKFIKKYYKDIDLFRIFACLAIFLYHLGILKGGYLAVCSFFVLSGYLSCISGFKHDKFSFKDYYLNKIKHLYIPLVVLVGISISVISYIPDVVWLNLKPETTSVLLGYNNYWQLGANIDYFTKATTSPFTHLWFMAIILQFDLVFPFIFVLLKKLGNWLKGLPIALCSILSIVSFGYFIYLFNNKGIMFAYYDTFSRLFALLLGVCLGFIHQYFTHLIPFKRLYRVVYFLYIALIFVIFMFIDSSSNLMILMMGLSTLISLRIIDYGTYHYKNTRLVDDSDKFFMLLSNTCFEIYLFQYLIIYLFQLYGYENIISKIIIIIITIIISLLIHLGLDVFKKKNIFRCILIVIILSFTVDGLYKFYKAVDHTPEMLALEEQMNNNEDMMLAKQEEYLSKQQEEQENWNEVLEQLDKDEKALKDYVSKIKITGVGDSVMLGAINNLYAKFSNSYFDAKVSRTDYEAPKILRDLKNKGKLGDIIIINLGANGQCPEYCKTDIMNIVGNRTVLWLNVTNDKQVHVNAKLENIAKKYSNLYIIDWNKISSGHKEYFVSDGIHLTSTGRVAYTNAIFDYIYNMYLKEFNEKKNNIINEHNNELKTKISFFGNDLLLNSFDDIHDSFSDAKFLVKNYTYNSLISDIKKEIENKTLNYKVVIALDKELELTKEQYSYIRELLKDNELYIVKTGKDIIYIECNVLDFSSIISNKDYLTADNRHLNKEGNLKLKELLINNIK